MAANRQERELMRQRGAGTRQIRDLEFQLVLPGQPIVPKEALSPQKSGRSRRTPQKRKILGPRSSTRKPATARKKRAGKPSSSEVPISEDQDGMQGALPTQSNREGKATKKRKIGVRRTEGVIESNGLGLAADEGPVTTRDEQGDLPQANETSSKSGLPQAHGKKRKKRKSIGQNSRKKPRLQNVDRDPKCSIHSPEEAPRPVDHQGEALVDSQSGEIKKQSQNSAEIMATEPELLARDSAQDLGAEEIQNQTVALSKSSAERKPRRKKRRPIGQQRPRRKVIGVATAGGSVPPTHSDAAEVASKTQDGSSIVKKSQGKSWPKKTLSAIDVGDVQDENLQGTDNTDVNRNTRAARNRGQSKKIPSPADVDVQDGALKDINNSNVTRNARGRGRPKKISSSADDDVHDGALKDKNNSNATRNTRSARGKGRAKNIPSALDVGHVQDEVLPDLNSSDITRNARTVRGRGPGRKGKPVDAAIQREPDGDDDNEGPRPIKEVPTRKRGRPRLNALPETSEASITVKKQRTQRKDTRDPDAKIPSASRKPPKNSMPITVSRMSTNDALHSENGHLDSLIDPSAFPKNNSVNAVDVLSQICRELVSKSTDSLGKAAKNEDDQSKKATLERKRKTIEMYGEELDNRLFQLTETLDNNIALSARVRRADKQEKALRAELESLQEERESIAQQTTQTEEANAKSRARAKLTTLLREIEAAVSHGREMDLLQPTQEAGAEEQQDGQEESGNQVVQTRGIGNLDFLLRRVGDDVKTISEAGGGGGAGSGGLLLDQVESVNSLLENAIAAE